MVVSSWEHVFKAFERIQCTHGNDYDCNKHNNSQCLEYTQRRRRREADPILDGEKLLEEEMATHSSILTWEIRDRGVWWAIVHGVAKELDTT